MVKLTKKQIRSHHRYVQRILRRYYTEQGMKQKGVKFYVIKDRFFKEFNIKISERESYKKKLVEIYLSGEHKFLKRGSEYLKKKKKGVKGKSRKQIYKDYLNSKEWAQIKIDLYQTGGKQCEHCGSTNRIEVHHLHYDNVFNEEPEDLVLLCRQCHQAEHN